MSMKILVHIGFLKELFVKPKYLTESSSSERTVYFDTFGYICFSNSITEANIYKNI